MYLINRVRVARREALFASPQTHRLTRPVVVHFDSDSIDIPLKLRPYRRIRIWEKTNTPREKKREERREKKSKNSMKTTLQCFPTRSHSLIFRSMKMKRIDETNVDSI